MLDPWIIEEIRRREEEERAQREHQPVVEIPIEMPHGPEHGHRPDSGPSKDERGVTIVDFRV